MSDDFLGRLRRLGVTKGSRNLKPAAPQRPLRPQTTLEPSSNPQTLRQLFPGGRVEETAVGGCFVLDKVYPISYQHGADKLQDLLTYSANPAAIFCQDSRFNELPLRDFLFLDTETTGLAGAGTLAFMVGVAFFEQEAFVVRQYFLRDHADEAAMLTLLDGLLAEKAGLITFNGRTFDLPLLDTRFLMNRMPSDIRERPHLDLLQPARRLWRNRLGSVALGNLEKNLLGLRRTHEDVEGWLIPTLYHDYLRSGDASAMQRVFYHNQIDMLSMVTLACRVIKQFAHPSDGDNPLDLFSLGRWQVDLGLIPEAEQNYRHAVVGDLPLAFYHQALRRLGLLLKRNGRRDEAISLWQQWAATSFDTVEPHVELAKHYEWHAKDIPTAIQWTEAAINLSNSWPPAHSALIHAELNHRNLRLKAKLNR